MPGAARITDKTQGHFSGEHGGHYDEFGSPIHNGGSLSGVIITGSNNVIINGLKAARKTDRVQEYDACTDGIGIIREGSSTVMINGLPASRIGDSITPHTPGSDVIVSGSRNVIIGG